MKNSDERGDYFLNQFKTSIFEFDSEFDVEFDIFLMKINFFLFFYWKALSADLFFIIITIEDQYISYLSIEKH